MVGPGKVTAITDNTAKHEVCSSAAPEAGVRAHSGPQVGGDRGALCMLMGLCPHHCREHEQVLPRHALKRTFSAVRRCMMYGFAW
jgi:hypothetical protein